MSLQTRVDDERIEAALLRHLTDDPDPQVKARIANKLGLYHNTNGTDALLQALADTSGLVRFQALWALGQMEGDLPATQLERLQRESRRLAADKHRGARREAMIRVESFVDGWIGEALLNWSAKLRSSWVRAWGSGAAATGRPIARSVLRGGVRSAD